MKERPRAAGSVLALALRLGGRQSGLVFLEGLIAERSGDRDRATRCFQEALEADPGNAPAREWLAALLAQSGRKREALHHANQLRVAGGVTAEFAFELGRLLAKQERDHGEALGWFETAEKLGHHAATLCRAHCLLNLGRAQEAFDLYQEASRQEQVHPSVTLDSKLGMAKATFDLGDAQRALTLARAALADHEPELRSEDVAHAREVIAWLESEIAHTTP